MAQPLDGPRCVFLGDGLVGIGLHRDTATRQVALVFDLLASPAGIGVELPSTPSEADQPLLVISASNTAALDALAEMVGRARKEMTAMEGER